MPLYKPGEVHDAKGYPIYPGDLLKSFHFRGARRKRHWLYHVAVWNAEQQTIEMVPVSHLEPSKRNLGGRCWLNPDLGATTEIILGHGPGDCLDHTDRPRRKPTPAAPAAQT